MARSVQIPGRWQEQRPTTPVMIRCRRSVTTTAAPEGGVGCFPAAQGRTRRGARPSAAAAARARPCTCPCRRACWSPRSTTRWRGAASAATASTCRDAPSPPTYYRPARRRSAASAARARRSAGRGVVAPAYVRACRTGRQRQTWG